MSWWSDRVLPHVVDRACGVGDIHKLRVVACAGLRGRVLEIGFGSGHNVQHYPTSVDQVAAVEPSDTAWQLSEPRRAHSSVEVIRSGLDGQVLLEQDDSCDSALTTFTLCTIPDAQRALAEVRRVLRPGGHLHFLEHGLAPDEGVRRWQRRLDPAQQALFGGCHLTRDVPALLEEAGFDVVEVEQSYLPGPRVARPWGFGSVGRAVARP